MRKVLLTVILVVLTAVVTCLPVFAMSNTTYTYTLSVNKDWIRTQDAYMPGKIYLKNANLANPSDIFVHDGLIYVADTGNWRVVVYNPKEDKISYLGEGELMSPRGVFVTDNGLVYVADDMSNAVYIFDKHSGKVVSKIGRPKGISEESLFEPRNVVVNSQGFIYVVGTGAYEGILQFNQKGEFLGYFSPNTRSLSLLEMFQNLFFSEKQKELLLTRKPKPVENIDVSDKDLIYAVTQSNEKERSGGDANSIKKCNFAGVNMFSGKSKIVTEANFVDVAAGYNNNFFALTYTGVINEYDESGELLFSFGGRAVSVDRLGLFSKASAIDTDENGFVYVLDSERGYIQVFYPTEYAVNIHQAMKELNSGRYENSEKIWHRIQQLNGMSRLAHIGYGKSLLSQQKFAEAMEHFKTANEKAYYSDAMWELRNQILNRYMPYILIILMVVIVACYIKSYIAKKNRKPVVEGRQLLSSDDKSFRTDLNFVFYMMKHPIDGFYYIKRGYRGGFLSASVIYILIFIVFIADRLFRGFVFNETDLTKTPIISIVISFILPLFLWVIMSYMISSINDGEGTLKKIYISTAYALSPYLIISPIVTAISHVLTLNEAFIVDFGWNIAVIWSAVLLFISVREIQNYKFTTTIKNIILTFLLIILAIVTCLLLYLMFKQMIVFFEGLWKELAYRATL